MKKMKKFTALVMGLLLTILLPNVASAKLEAGDQGIYIKKTQEGEISAAYLMRLASNNKYWTMDFIEGNQWKRLGCAPNKECRFTQSFPPTLKRFFAKHPDVIKIINNEFKGLAISCVDAKPVAFCRLDQTDKAIYLLVDQASELSIIEKYQDLPPAQAQEQKQTQNATSAPAKNVTAQPQKNAKPKEGTGNTAKAKEATKPTAKPAQPQAKPTAKQPQGQAKPKDTSKKQ